MEETGLLTEVLVFNDAMLASAIVLTITFIGIFSENLHGMERSKFASLGAVTMILVGQYYGFYSPDEALEAIDWNVVFLLGAMMTIVSIMIPTGGFNMVAAKIAQFSGKRMFLLMALMGTAVTVFSLLLDNVTTVVIFGPLIILIARAQKVSPVPYLLAAALLADTGGVATLVGDPPNLMIGSAADISFNAFLLKMGPITMACWFAILMTFKILFRKELKEVPQGTFDEKLEVKNKKVWNASLIILGFMTILFMFHHALHWEPWFVAALGMTALVFVSRHVVMDAAFEHVEITLLLFFIGLFVVIGGVEHSQFLMYLGQYITPFVQNDLFTATIVLMWVGAVFSAAIDNIPFTAAMIPIILSFEQAGVNVAPLWWGLAMGVGLGGNGTHIGSTANVFIVTISERLAKQENDPSLAITPWVWFKKGTPAMIVTLIVASLFMWGFWDYMSQPLHEFN